MTWEDIPGWFDWPQLYDHVVSRYDGGILVEVGNYLGRSLCYLGDQVKRSGKPFHVVGVDWGVGSGVEDDGNDHHHAAVSEGGGTMAGQLHRNVLACGLKDVITLITGDSVRAASLFPNFGLTMVFIDANHSYASVSADIRTWLPKVRVGGVLAGDDIGLPDEPPEAKVWPGVVRAVNELLPGWDHGPHDAWMYTQR